MKTYRLKFHPEFFRELEDAIEYYLRNSKSAALRFRLGVKKQLELIRKRPHTRAVRYSDVRFAIVEKFPYVIHYSIDTENRQVYIHALGSDYQDPEMHWVKRL